MRGNSNSKEEMTIDAGKSSAAQPPIDLARLRSPRLLVLIGAGASYDSGCMNPERPPLGNQLFNRLKAFNRRFLGTLEGRYTKIPQKILSLFSKDFEEAMRRLRSLHDEFNDWGYLQILGAYFCRFAPPKEGNA